MKKTLAGLFFVTCSLFGGALEEVNVLIEKEKIPWAKQQIICGREAVIDLEHGNADECLKAAKMILDLKGKKSSNIEYLRILTGHNSIERAAGECFYNAGVIYYKGGVSKNHIKAYEYFKEALKNDFAKGQLGIAVVCSESPWACK